MAGESPPSLSNIPQVVNAEGEVVLRGRTRNVNQLTSAYQTFWWADRASNAMRTMHQQQRDGAPPYDPGRDRLLGLGGRANINFGEVNQLSVAANQPFNALIDGIDYLCTLPTNYGSESDRMYWEEVMAEEFNRSVRSWDQFIPLWQINNRLFIDEGVSFVHFQDDLNWQYDVKGQQYFVFPRRTRASVEFLGQIYYKDYLMPSALYEHCRDDKAAADEGWNKGACWEAIKQAAEQHSLPSNDFQEWEKAWKNNDMFFGATDITIEVIGGLLKEVDGTISNYLARADGQGEFLYKSEGKFKSMSRAIVPYLNGVGTNNDFHSIRGLLYMVAPAAAGRNRALCRFLDRVWHDSTPFIESPTEDILTELPLMPLGQYGVLRPGVKFTEAHPADFAGGLIPAMQFLGQIMGSNASSYNTSGPSDPSSQPRTKYEKEMEYAREGKISSSAMDLFKVGFQMHMREVVRRFIRPSYSSAEPGGWFVTGFRARCLNRGVPSEAIDRVDVNRVEVNMGIGSGSAVERKTVADFLYDKMYPNMDAEGKNRCSNMVAAAHAGSRVANVLFPLQPGLRPPQDTENAQLENFVLTNGGEVEVLLNQNHEVHLERHLLESDKINQQLIPHMDALQNAVPGQDTAPQASSFLEQAIPKLSALFQHEETHYELLSPASAKRPMFKKLMSDLRETITNGAKQLASQQMKMMREAQHNNGVVGGESQPQAGGQNGQGANTSTLVQSAEAAQSFRDASQQFAHKQETRQMQLALTRADLQNKELDGQSKRQDMILKNAKTAAEISSKHA